MGVGVARGGVGSRPRTRWSRTTCLLEKRSSVFAILNSAVPFGVFCGFIIGGWVNQHYGWRAAFMVVGLPGVLIALLIWLTVREPPRWLDNRTDVAPVPLGESLGYLWRTRSYRHLVLATIFTLGAIGSGIWIPSFFVRVHGMANAEVAVWLAFIYGGGGVLGAMLGDISPTGSWPETMTSAGTHGCRPSPLRRFCRSRSLSTCGRIPSRP